MNEQINEWINKIFSMPYNPVAQALPEWESEW